MAIGLLIERSAVLEHQIQRAFCALAGSKFAAAVAGDQEVGWLIEKCEALADAHHELPDVDRSSIEEALRSCHQAYMRRNEILQSGQAAPSHAMTPIENPQNASPLCTVADIHEAGEALLRAGSGLANVIQRALWPERGLDGEGGARRAARQQNVSG